MKRLLFFLTLFSVSGMQASDKSSEPTFYIVNNSDRDVHFTAVGANDLLTIKNLELVSPHIVTLKHGDEYEERLSLRGELDDKPVLLYLYPNPQGEQEIMRVAVDISRDNIHTVIEDLMGDERIYRLGKGKPVYIEVTPGYDAHKYGLPLTSYYEGLTIKSLSQDRDGFYSNGQYFSGVTKSKDIKRAWAYEVLGRWAMTHTAEFQEFIETIDTFVYTYLRAGNIVTYIWRYGIKGARDIARVRSIKARIEKKIGMKL